MDQKFSPKISIITPSYNQSQFVEDTILSVISQKTSSVEYIIMDGGSTDNSVEIIQKYEEKISQWVSEPDEGQSDAINKGVSMAGGEWIGWWINSVDILTKEHVVPFIRYWVSSASTIAKKVLIVTKP